MGLHIESPCAPSSQQATTNIPTAVSCRRLALGVPLQVISVTYRLTPEHAYPVPLDDVWAAYFALATSLPPSTPLLLIGSSAGAHLLAICAQRARGMRHIRQPSGLLLRCPVTTHPLSIPVRFQAMYDAWQPASGRPLEKLLLPPTKMDVCHVELAVPVELRASGEAYPLNGELRGLLGGADGGAGRVWVQACDDDVLMPDAVAYVDALREAGIEAALQEVSGGHTFWLKEPGTQAAEAAEDAAVEGAKWVLEGCTGQ